MIGRREFLAGLALLGVISVANEEQHFWTGSEWLTGAHMHAPERGVTRLLTVPTTAGWRVELGDPTYPIRYWDGTNTNFSVDDSGDITARSITLYPTLTGTSVVKVDSTGVPSNAHAFSFFDSSGGERFYIRSQAGEIRSDSSFQMYGNLTDANPVTQMDATGAISFGAGGGTATDIRLYRSAANILALNTGDSFAWTGAATSILHSSGYVQLAEIAAPATPGADLLRLYAKDSAGVSRLFYKDDAGVEHGPL